MRSSRRRPALSSAGVVACLALLAGCGGVDVDPPHPTGAALADCKALVADLPASVADQKRRAVSPAGALAAAWGDPAIVLRCGVRKPVGFGRASSCMVANGVGWYVPEDQMTTDPRDITMTAVGREAYVEVFLPADYLPPATAMVDLADVVKRHVPQVHPCV